MPVARLLAPRRRATTVTAAVLAVAAVPALALVGLSPQPVESVIGTPLFRFLLWASQHPALRWLSYRAVETLGNVLFFIPVGIIAFLLIPRMLWPLSLAVGPVLATGIELGQWALLPERTASFADIAANSVGATIGVALASAVSLSVALVSAKVHRRAHAAAMVGSSAAA